MRTSPAAIATFLILWKNQKQKRRWASGRPVSSAGGYALHYTGIPPGRGREPPLPPHKLREHGVTDYAQVAKAYMESDGEISVIKRHKKSPSAKNRGLTCGLTPIS
jgi:hypothetical protein